MKALGYFAVVTGKGRESSGSAYFLLDSRETCLSGTVAALSFFFQGTAVKALNLLKNMKRNFFKIQSC